MKQFFSLSQFPGRNGESYYNSMFARFGMDHTYTALPCTNLEESIIDLVKCGASGISISMPFKYEILNLLDTKDDIVEKFQCCNTVLVEYNGELTGYNTDYYGAMYILSLINPDDIVSILGDGSMAKMFAELIGPRATMYSRKNNTWGNRYLQSDVIINCTAFGTSTSESPFSNLPNTKMVVDLATKPNQLELQCADEGVKYISGIEFYKRQFVKQFELYTGQELSPEDL